MPYDAARSCSPIHTKSIGSSPRMRSMSATAPACSTSIPTRASGAAYACQIVSWRSLPSERSPAGGNFVCATAAAA